MALLLTFPWRALHWFDWILLVVIEREEYFWLLDYSVLSARFPCSQYPNHHFRLLLEQRNTGTCCPPSAGTAAPLAISIREEHTHGAGKLSPFSHITAACWQPAHVCTHQEGSTFPWACASIIHSLLQQRNSIIQKQILKQQLHSWRLLFLLKGAAIFGENPSPSQPTPWFLVEVKSI